MYNAYTKTHNFGKYFISNLAIKLFWKREIEVFVYLLKFVNDTIGLDRLEK